MQIGEALKYEINYPLAGGSLEQRAIVRGLDLASEFTAEIAQSKAYKGALADLLYSVCECSAISEADKSLSFDVEFVRKKAMRLYKEIGEADKIADVPRVYIGL